MAEPETICSLFREKVSGRAARRILHRATACGLCGKPMGPAFKTDRWLYRAYTGFSKWHLTAAHPACAAAEQERIAERRSEEYWRLHPPTPADLMLLALILAEEDRMILGIPRPGGYDGILGTLS